MKLPDFFQFSELDSLRSRMGIPSGVYGDLKVTVDAGRLTEDELDRLTSVEGLDLASLDDLRILPDGTLAFKDKRVLLYIRDHNIFGNRNIDPKFHVANCITLQEMKRQTRFQRYVIATRLTGEFRLNFTDGARRRDEIRKLAICKNCMEKLNFDGFKTLNSKLKRDHFVRQFSLITFFEKFPISLHKVLPDRDADTAPIDDYAQDFSAKSSLLRRAVNWTCQNSECNIWLGSEAHRKYLHVHHMNALKGDDRPENHLVLCIGCHAEQPSHGHMKSMPDYKSFLTIKANLSR